tara:strand:+ start:374 stop:751 length:378 start_codon:yes stop_codon:yes gene_type:complete
MDNVSYIECIVDLVPGAELSILDNDYNSIIWSNNNNHVKPTEEEIIAKKVELEILYPLKLLRDERNFRIMETDKYGLIDYKFSSDEEKQAWLTYRQLLRDLPNNQTPQLNSEGELINVTWPTPPS